MHMPGKRLQRIKDSIEILQPGKNKKRPDISSLFLFVLKSRKRTRCKQKLFVEDATFFDAGFLTCKIAEVIEFSTANFTVFVYND